MKTNRRSKATSGDAGYVFEDEQNFGCNWCGSMSTTQTSPQAEKRSWLWRHESPEGEKDRPSVRLVLAAMLFQMRRTNMTYAHPEVAQSARVLFALHRELFSLFQLFF